MVSAYADITATATLTKKGAAAQTITSNIISYNDSGIKRDVKFERAMGGAYLPSMVFASELSLTFTYITTSATFIDVMQGTVSGQITDIEVFNLYKVVLKFNDGTNALGKVYYNCYPITHTYSQDDGVVRGTMTFKLSPKNISANSNYYEFNGTISAVDSAVTSKDTLMEWT